MKDLKRTSRRHRITATVKEVKGNCPIYKPGDTIAFEHFYITPRQTESLCIHALSAMNTLLSPFIHGVDADDLGIGASPDLGYLQCPDPGPPYTHGGTVVFELKRTRLGPQRPKPSRPTVRA